MPPTLPQMPKFAFKWAWWYVGIRKRRQWLKTQINDEDEIENMKTVEEKAKEYSNSEGIYNEHGERLLYMGFSAGYAEATRWRDPKVESPEEDGLYLCKCKSNRLGFYFEVVFLNKVWQTNNIIGWRPIE